VCERRTEAAAEEGEGGEGEGEAAGDWRSGARAAGSAGAPPPPPPPPPQPALRTYHTVTIYDVARGGAPVAISRAFDDEAPRALAADASAHGTLIYSTLHSGAVRAFMCGHAPR
jgi:hypothetical protein